MSEADPADVRLETVKDGVRVEKTFEPEDFPVPAIAFAIRSERDEHVEVRITDQVPDPVDPQDIGFHPKYGAEFWSVDDGHIVFERGFEPGEEYTTVYGLRSESDGAEQYLSEPTIDRIDPPLPGNDEDGDDGGPTTPTGPEIPDDDGDDETGAGVGVEPGELAEALATEIRDGEASEATVETLRDALGVEAPGSVSARLDRVQSDVSDLRAYTDALEEFLDENGDAQQLLAELDDRIETFGDRIEELDDRIGTFGDRAEEIDDRIETFGDRIEELDDRLATTDEKIDGVETDVEDLRAIEQELEEIRDDIDALAEMREQLSSVFAATAGAGDDE